MSRILRSLWLAMGAMAVLFALSASAAHAATGALTAGAYPAIITGQQGPGASFDINGVRNVECATSDLSSTIMGPADPVTFKPVYTNCISNPGALPATVTPKGCHYQIGVSKPGTTNIVMPTTGKMGAGITCPDNQIEIHVYENAMAHAANVSTCTYDIGPQGPVPGGIYHNVAANPNDVLATVNATFNALNTIGPAAICGGEAFQNIPITLTGNYTLKGFVDMAGGVEGGQIPIEVD